MTQETLLVRSIERLIFKWFNSL